MTNEADLSSSLSSGDSPLDFCGPCTYVVFIVELPLSLTDSFFLALSKQRITRISCAGLVTTLKSQDHRKEGDSRKTKSRSGGQPESERPDGERYQLPYGIFGRNQLAAEGELSSIAGEM